MRGFSSEAVERSPSRPEVFMVTRLRQAALRAGHLFGDT